MTRKIYRTAQGKMVDLGRLQLQNENTRAVGNMKVNARGDLIDSRNRPIVNRNEQVARQYRRQTAPGNAVDGPVPSSRKNAIPTEPPAKVKKSKIDIPKPPEDFEDDVTKQTVAENPAPGAQGLAAAIARARQVKQEAMKTPREVAQQTPGVKKL